MTVGQNDTRYVSYITGINDDLVVNETLNSTSVENKYGSDDVGYIRYSFVIIGGFALLLSFVFGFIYVLMPLQNNAHQNHVSNKRVESERNSSNKLIISFVSMASFSMACFVLRSWITPFVLEYLDWNARDGQYIAAAFGSGMVAGRLIGILLLVWLSPAFLLFSIF